MKDKTDSMNRGFSTEEAEAGFSDPGTSMSRRQYKARQMKVAGLLSDTALSEYENTDGDEGGQKQPGGFLRRNNYDERF